MKKKYSLICSSVFALFSFTANAVNIPVSVTNNAFAPQTFTAQIGDVVVWTWNSTGMTHNITSNGSSVPAGAAPLASGNMSSGTYSYTITTAGNYGYFCSLHLPGMAAGFTVSSATNIAAPATNLLTNIYPNPFQNNLFISYNGIDAINVFNIIGEKVKNIELAATESKIDVGFENLPSGVYFFTSSKEGIIVETKRIVKSK